MSTASENQSVSREEEASYHEQDYAGHMLIDAMTSINQTCARNRNFGLDGWHEYVVVRTDHIGGLRRWIIRALMNSICILSRPAPEKKAASNHQASNDTTPLLERFYFVGYQGLCLPRWLRRLTARHDLHYAWMRGYQAIYRQEGSDAWFGVCDRDWHRYRKCGIKKIRVSMLEIMAVILRPHSA